jgi:preprotein translocase subunit YajC
MKSLVILFLASPALAFAPPPGEGGQQTDPLSQMFLMIAIFMAIIYFIIIRPQQKEQKRHQQRIDSLKKGDRIITAGGIHGEVRSTKEKTLVLEIAEGVKITLNKSAVSTVTEEGSGQEEG